MLYNKNNVRKTNDKKILHKVGKQWKVVSVALLMAIGGGAAVAATNNTSANADANNGSQYTMNAQTSAEVQSLEANPNVGQSSAPAKQSSKAASASTSAPTMPSLSLNPDPSLNGHNADAEYNRVKQGYDNAVIKYYGNKVQSYVSEVNAKYPSEASTVNSKYEAASSNQSNDRSLASSYAATASGKNWSAEVSNIASAKSGIDASAYIETVGYNVSNNASDVSARAKALSGASAIASYATLISEINNNSGVSNEYYAKYLSASANNYIASNAYHDADLLFNNFASNSVDNQSAYYSASANSVALSAHDRVAVDNSGIDAQYVSALAKSLYGYNANNASSYAVQASNYNSIASSAVSAVAKTGVSLGDGQYSFADVNDNRNGYFDILNNTVTVMNQQFSNINNDKSAINSLNTNIDSYASELSNAVKPSEKANLASKAYNYIKTPTNNFSLSAEPESEAINTVASTAANLISGANAKSIASEITSYAKAKGVYNPVATVSASGTNITAKMGHLSTNIGTLLSNGVNSLASNYNDHKAQDDQAVSDIKAGLANKEQELVNAKNNLKADYEFFNATNEVANVTNGSDAYRVLNDTATQQNYGADKSYANSIVASAASASAKYSTEVSSAGDALNVASANYNAAKSAVNNLDMLGNSPYLAEIENGYNGIASNGSQVSDAPLVSEASAYAFYTGNYGVSSLLNTGYSNSSEEGSIVDKVTSAANQAGKDYTSASNASLAYAKNYDADFVLASSYATSYEDMSSGDQSAFNSASSARSNFYNTYAGNNYGSDEDMLTTAQSDEPNAAGLANGNATYVLKHEPHVVTVTKQLVMHRNPNYNDKTDTPADAKLAVINKGTHLMVTNVGFDKHGNTRLYVDYKGTKGFITGLRNYVTDSYLIPGQKYTVTFNRTAHEYSSLQFNHASATKDSVKAGQPVTGTAVLNDDGEHFLGLTRLQLTNGNYVTTLDTFIKNATPLNNNGQAATQKGAYFWNGQDTTFLNK